MNFTVGLPKEIDYRDNIAKKSVITQSTKMERNRSFFFSVSQFRDDFESYARK